MKFATVTDLKARLSAYLKESTEGPVIVTRNGRPVAMLIAVGDETDLEDLVLAHSPKLRAYLDSGKRQIEASNALGHGELWESLSTDSG